MDKLFTIALCNFNTTELTNQSISTLEQHLPNIPHTYLILDNSDIEPLQLSTENQKLNYKLLDNTNGKYINFEQVVKTFCDPKFIIKHSHNGSLKHCYSVQILLDICPTNLMLLIDSDIIVNKNIDFISEEYATVAHAQLYNTPNEKNGPSCGKIYTSASRFLPYIQLFNINMLNLHNIKYFDPLRMHGGLNGNNYDTGAAFYENILKSKVSYKCIDYHDYIFHYAAMSWKKFDIEHKYSNP